MTEQRCSCVCQVENSRVVSACEMHARFVRGEAMIVQALAAVKSQAPIPMLLWCPGCSARHIDEGAFATKEHETHACQSCGLVWRPAIVPTVGVQFLPGYKNEEK